MKRLFFVFVLWCNCAFSQKTFDHELQLTESKFALESQIHGLKWGFLHNMDTGAFGLGRQGYMNLYKSWESRPETPGFVLLWKPAVVYWSTDGLFGITSGPFYSKNATDTVLNQNGLFFTIWKRNKLSEPFKFVLDIGVNLAAPSPSNLTRDTGIPKYPIPVQKSQLLPGDLSSYNKLAGAASLQSALFDHSNDQTYFLFSGHGVVKRSELSKVAATSGQFELVRTGWKRLAPSAYYEWGTIHRQGAQSANASYFVHVWTNGGKGPKLIAAMYRID
jgi:hypothetical protein